jgi:hypothetical protein
MSGIDAFFVGLLIGIALGIGIGLRAGSAKERTHPNDRK